MKCFRIIEKKLSDFGIENNLAQIIGDRAQIYSHFASGEIQILMSSSGLFPQDISGDLQMLFTPNLHLCLKFASQDEKMQNLIESLRQALPATEKRKITEELNRHLYREALCGVYLHSRRFILHTKVCH